MKYYSLPNDDRIPALGLGTWKSSPKQVAEAVKTAILAGYRHIDCAAIYGNEDEVGEGLREAAREVRREDIWLTSKLWNSAHKAEDVEPALKKTLSDLKVDYLDLYLIHWPVHLKPGVAFPRGPEEFISYGDIPIAETWSALEECVKNGLVKHLGVSNFSAKKIEELLRVASIKPVVNQVESHPYLPQNELLSFCRANNILLTAYSPLGSKDRPKPMKKESEPSLLDNPAVQAVAGENSISAAQVLISWAISRGTIVIPKSVNAKRIKENLAAAEFELSPADMEKLAALDKGYRYVDGSFWAAGGSPYTLKSLWDE